MYPMSHLNQEELVLIYYREPGIPPSAASHLSECAQCRADFDALAETLNACLDWTPPEPPLDFGRSVWASLAPQLVEQRRPVLPMRTWFAIAAAMVLLIGAFIAGRASRPPQQPSLTAGLSPQARARIFAITMADHLDRAEVLLTELENSDNKDDAAFASERERARDLVQEGRMMRQMVASRGEADMLPLLDDLERVVLEIANSPDTATPRELRELKQSIGSESLLFKVRIVESNLRSEGRKI
jgi:hypothetical protein